MKQFERNVASSPKTILNVLGHIRQKHRHVDSYLKFCGISDEQLLRLQTTFIQ